MDADELVAALDRAVGRSLPDELHARYASLIRAHFVDAIYPLAAPAVTETNVYDDPARWGERFDIDAYLASPQAAEELARALLLHDVVGPDAIRADRWDLYAGTVSTQVLAALQKVRHPEEAG